MNRPILLFFLFATLASCKKNKPDYKVDNFGVLREIMMENKLDKWMALDTFSNQKNLYALGATTGLGGEILILNSEPILSKASNGEVRFQRDFDNGAILLVNSTVEKWTQMNFDTTIDGLASLQTSIKAMAEAQGLDTSKPFPFMIEGNFSEVNWHIINAAEATEQNHEAYKKAGLKGHSVNEKGRILGFYSENHEGIFTHHGSYLHAHFVNDSITKMGHVDEIVFDKSVVVSLPKSAKE